MVPGTVTVVGLRIVCALLCNVRVGFLFSPFHAFSQSHRATTENLLVMGDRRVMTRRTSSLGIISLKWLGCKHEPWRMLARELECDIAPS
jgi:hypothetical protein